MNLSALSSESVLFVKDVWEGELINTPGICLVGASVSTCLEGPGFHGERRSHEPQWGCNSRADLSATDPWWQPWRTSGRHTYRKKSSKQPPWEVHVLYLHSNSTKALKCIPVFAVFTVRCCMISCSRAALASSWLWSGVCCSSIDRICPSCGSSSSLRSPTRNDCRTIRSRRGTVLSANTQAPQIASLQIESQRCFNHSDYKS